MHQKALEIRNFLADNGVERTPKQASQICDLVDDLFHTVDFEAYSFFTKLRGKELRKYARRHNFSPNDVREVRELVLQCYEKKIERQNGL